LEDSPQPFDFLAFRKILEEALAAALHSSRSSIVDAKVAAHAALGNILCKNKE
jgi:hypothetical protein